MTGTPNCGRIAAHGCQCLLRSFSPALHPADYLSECCWPGRCCLEPRSHLSDPDCKRNKIQTLPAPHINKLANAQTDMHSQPAQQPGRSSGREQTQPANGEKQTSSDEGKRTSRCDAINYYCGGVLGGTKPQEVGRQSGAAATAPLRKASGGGSSVPGGSLCA